MPSSEKDYQKILQEYDTLRAEASADRDRRTLETYQKVPEVESIDQRIEQFGLRAMQNYLRSHKDPKEILEEAKGEIAQLNARKEAILRQHGLPADYRQIRYHCPYCEDTGYVDGKRCRCFDQKLIALAYRRSNLNELLARQNFQTFDLSLFSEEVRQGEPLSARENMRRILDLLHEELETFSPFSSLNLLLKGPTGTGKTFLCSCIAKAVLDRNCTVLYLSAYDLCRLMSDYRYRYRSGAEAEANSEKLEFVYSCDLLLVDDLGTEVINSVSNADLLHLINHRIQAGNSTVLSTNCDLKQLQQNYSDRMLSRLMGSYRIINFYGADLRMKNLQILN